MSLIIPPFHRVVPKLETKVVPVNPAVEQEEDLDVVMDVVLNEDGSVQNVNVIQGNPLLNSTATDAVKQWKYTPLKVDGKLVNKLVVVVTFAKNGKVHLLPE